MSESTPEDRIEQQSTPTRDAERRQDPAVPLEAPAADWTSDRGKAPWTASIMAPK